RERVAPNDASAPGQDLPRGMLPEAATAHRPAASLRSGPSQTGTSNQLETTVKHGSQATLVPRSALRATCKPYASPQLHMITPTDAVGQAPQRRRHARVSATSHSLPTWTNSGPRAL